MFDLVIKNGVCFVDGDFKQCNIGIEGRKIAYVGKENISGEEEINGKGCAILPGFFNAHTHSAMTILRGYAESLPLKEWLEKIWKVEAKLGNEEIYWASKFSCIEMLKHGITCFADMYIYMDEVARAVSETGIRAVLGYGMADRGSEERREKELKIALNFIERWHGEERITCTLTPHAIYTCSVEFLTEIAEVATSMGLIKHIHASETLWEVKEAIKRYGKTPVELLNSIGFLDDKTVLAHCVWLNESEIAILAKNKVSVAHCPSSNLKLSSGIAKLSEMIEQGINVAVGTDGAASNNLLNMLSELRLAALLQQLRRKFLKPSYYLVMGTENGYRAFGINGGVIREGMLADLIVIEISMTHYPLYDLINSLLFSSRGCEVRDVIVNGKIVVEDRTAIFVDEEEVIEKFNALSERLRFI
ncbi:MAG: amidohydrolase [Archaeoglobaceae archaeon]